MNKNNLKSYQAPKLFELEAGATQSPAQAGTKTGNAIESSQGAPATKRPS